MASVIMFHSVGLRELRWFAPQISEDVGAFRNKLRALAAAGYRSVRFTDPAAWEPVDRRDRVVCLTFDDGYLDNWVHVFPMLQEFGFQASIFVTPEFVDPRDVVRPHAAADFVENSGHDPARCCAGFLSWPEMRAMEATGLVEIQSHALTHDFQFTGPRIVDYWRPGAATRPGGPVWMLWNAFPEEKPFYLTRAAELEARIPWGTPVYEHGKALEGPRWSPDEPAVERAVVEHVEARGGLAFFQGPRWRSELDGVVERVRGGEARGEFESGTAYLERVRHELVTSKETIEERLGHEVPALVWPGGGVSRPAFEIAREVGYRIFSHPEGLSATSGPDAVLVHRIGSACRVHWRGRDLGNVTGREFLWYLGREQGGQLDRWRCRLAKAVRIAGATSGFLRV